MSGEAVNCLRLADDMRTQLHAALLMPIIGGSTAVQLNNIANWAR